VTGVKAVSCMTKGFQEFSGQFQNLTDYRM
jgi:hypothetical protein